MGNFQINIIQKYIGQQLDISSLLIRRYSILTTSVIKLVSFKLVYIRAERRKSGQCNKCHLRVNLHLAGVNGVKHVVVQNNGICILNAEDKKKR